MLAKLTTLLAAVTAVYAPAATFAQGPATSFASAAPATDAPAAAGVFLNLRHFEIPFSVDSSGTRPVSVELFVSRDGGGRWALLGSQPATGRHFQFTAPSDGRYWFATRTIDAAGNPHPPDSQIAPQLQVTVDTAKPQLSLDAEVDAAGHVQLNYVYADAAPATEEIQIQYVTDANRTEWVAVSLASHDISAHADGTQRGRVAFSPNGNWRYLHVRLVAHDQAGNQTVVVEQIEKPRIAGTPAQLASGFAPSDPPAGGGYDGGYAMHAPQPQATQPRATQPQSTAPARGTPPPASSAAAMDAGPTTNPYAGGYAGAGGGTPTYRGLDHSSPEDAGPALPPAQSLRALPVSQSSANSFGGSAPSGQTAAPIRAAQNPAADPVPPSSAMRPISIETLPTPAGRPDEEYPTSRVPDPAIPSPAIPSPAIPEPATADPATPPTSAPTAAIDIDESEIRQSRSRQFSLDYEVEAVGSKGIDEVELWGSSDGGRSWSNWGSDPDRQSPFDIETVNSGLYGFCIVVVGGNGLTSRRPQPGDQADIYVRVDTTAPVVRLLAARYGEGDEAGSLVIEYAYEDENPVSRPVSLSFSENPNGPWTTIATGLENTGRYAWPADPRLPRQIYLRIEATDRAGNVGVEARNSPVAVQGLAPRARIRGFQPIEN